MNVYGLIGYPLKVSFSKNYFEEKFAKEDLTDCSFKLFPIEKTEEFKNIVAAHKDLLGVAVTIPHKQAIMPFLTHIDEAAKEVGAVNCIEFSGNEITGYNTDAKGFELSFLPLLKKHHKRALVLGTGGASKAVQYILKKNEIEFKLVSRTKTDSNLAYKELNEKILNEYNIIINCSPVGMSPDEESRPDIPYHLLTKDHLLYDLIYKPEKTKFLQEGEKQGCTIKNGFEMLIIQAEENWRMWND